MSTRGGIVRLTSKEKEPITFIGVYHHWDSYVSALGKTLFNLNKGFFKGDTEAMLKVLIDEHQAGWSTINDKDFSLTPGYRNDDYNRPANVSLTDYLDSLPKQPQCYCHGDRKEKAQVLTEKNASDCGCEYVYAFTGNTMLILSSYCEDGHKMIGAFGMGDPNATWKVIGEVDLKGKAPRWDRKTIKNRK